jgi:hypothetical protein
MEQIDPLGWARTHRSCVPSVVTFFNHAVDRREVPLTYNPFKGLSKKGGDARTRPRSHRRRSTSSQPKP